ncbi:hypothetical protein EJ05DRAFT_496317 [Pseudovirgaria hyperparasitica]|uniref:CFEM domain-containing protein n=1 Tax=Pseudovirgaria hyperparasitica TaxID=470096 RepID=A0A6A6WMX7_9PEZI|nr:uncharacterized protein EJ05DRAFT_496317 [Pseudovirgaria hyperparasitica]KAF2763498.1 hypothetical protein EJ05DRAFT_496317 [Pseudovirgaria hyperparasitica]
MYAWPWLFRCFTALSVITAGLAQGTEEFNLTVADLPPCGLSCFVHTIPAAGCGLTDLVCQCESRQLTELTIECMLQNCTMADTLQVSKVSASLCHLPNPSRAHEVTTVVLVMIAISVTFIAGRIVSKIKTSRKVEADDYCLVGALILASGSGTATMLMSKVGLGKHVWGLGPGDLKQFLMYFWVTEVNYVVVLSLVKCSLVLLYLRIFPTQKIRLAAWFTLGFIIITSIVLFFHTVFSCKPVSYFWDRDLHGTCLNIAGLAYAHAAIAVVTDFMIISIPLSMLPGLNMKLRKKIAVGLMFAVGSFGCVTSILRLQTIVVLGVSLDPTWEYIPIINWTAAELGVCFICACLPAVRILCQNLFPNLFSHWNNTFPSKSGNGYSNSSSRRHQGAGWKEFGSTVKNSRLSGRGDSPDTDEVKLTELSKCRSNTGTFSGNEVGVQACWASNEAGQTHVVGDGGDDEIGRMTPVLPPDEERGYGYAHVR